MEMNAFNLKWAGMQSEEEILARKEKRRARVVIPHYVENGLSFAYFEELPMYFYRIPLFLNRVLNYDEGYTDVYSALIPPGRVKKEFEPAKKLGLVDYKIIGEKIGFIDLDNIRFNYKFFDEYKIASDYDRAVMLRNLVKKYDKR